MKRLLILLILFFSSCQHNNNVKSLIDLVPTDPVLIIKNRTDLNNNLINFNNGLNQILVKNLDSITDYDSETLTSYHVIGKMKSSQYHLDILMLDIMKTKISLIRYNMKIIL